MKRPDPIVLFIVGFLVLTLLEKVGVLPHLVVVVLACSGAIAVVLRVRRKPPRRPYPELALNLMDMFEDGGSWDTHELVRAVAPGHKEVVTVLQDLVDEELLVREQDRWRRA